MKAQQLALNLIQRPRYHRAAFEVTSSNRSAFGFIDNWPGWPARRLLLVGQMGSGKTHLAHLWAEKSKAEFVDPAALTVESAVTMPRRPAFVIDNVQNAISERALFHFLNVVAQRRAWLLMTMDRDPAQTKFRLADLRSRLNGVPRCHLMAPDERLMVAILEKLFVDRQIAPDPAVISYISKRIERTVAAARQVVEAIDQRALAKRQSVNLSLARAVVQELET